jgi:hypothetical protein
MMRAARTGKKFFLHNIYAAFFLLASILFSVLSAGPAMAAGASLFISPATGKYTVGKSFTVNVMVNSGGGVGINSSEGVVKYDPALLAVTRVGKTSSIFNLWVTEPKFSNSSGEASFAGGSPTAYKGTAGTIFSITFSALKAGTAEVSVASGMVLAADGKGTNVASSLGKASYTLEEAQAEPKKAEPPPEPKETAPVETKKPSDNAAKDNALKSKETEKGMLPPLPKIQSSTHPDENIWYSSNNPEFNWKLLSDITNVSTEISASSTGDPGAKAEGVLEKKKFEKVQDGAWYVLVKFQNTTGWGEVAHRKVMIDSTPPDPFALKIDNGGDPTNPVPILEFTTGDKTSGISAYKLKIDGNEKDISVEEMADGAYQLPLLLPGEHNLGATAIDKAGNKQDAYLKIIIEPLRSPVITEIPKLMESKDALTIRGASFYPEATVKLYIGEEGKTPAEYSIQTDKDGNWAYFHKGFFNKGTYAVNAKVVDKRGAESYPTANEILTVVSPSIIDLYGRYIILALIFIIILTALYMYYIRRQYQKEIERIRRETLEMKDKLGKVFAALREEVDEVIEYADKKPGVSEAEKRVKDKLKEALDVSEEFLSKELEDVEKEIK